MLSLIFTILCIDGKATFFQIVALYEELVQTSLVVLYISRDLGVSLGRL